MKRVLAAAVVLLGWTAAPALAHHPFEAEYDWKRPVTLNGTISKVDWKDPHPMIHVTGRDDQGNQAEWTIELGRTAQLRRMGWTPTHLKSGEQITVDGWAARDGSKRLSAKSVKLSTGRELFAASSFFDTPRAQTASRTRTRGTSPTSGSVTTGRSTGRTSGRATERTTGREPRGTTGRQPGTTERQPQGTTGQDRPATPGHQTTPVEEQGQEEGARTPAPGHRGH